MRYDEAYLYDNSAYENKYRRYLNSEDNEDYLEENSVFNLLFSNEIDFEIKSPIGEASRYYKYPDLVDFDEEAFLNGDLPTEYSFICPVCKSPITIYDYRVKDTTIISHDNDNEGTCDCIINSWESFQHYMENEYIPIYATLDGLDIKDLPLQDRKLLTDYKINQSTLKSWYEMDRVVNSIVNSHMRACLFFEDVPFSYEYQYSFNESGTYYGRLINSECAYYNGNRVIYVDICINASTVVRLKVFFVFSSNDILSKTLINYVNNGQVRMENLGKNCIAVKLKVENKVSSTGSTYSVVEKCRLLDIKEIAMMNYVSLLYNQKFGT